MSVAFVSFDVELVYLVTVCGRTHRAPRPRDDLDAGTATLEPPPPPANPFFPSLPPARLDEGRGVQTPTKPINPAGIIQEASRGDTFGDGDFDAPHRMNKGLHTQNRVVPATYVSTANHVYLVVFKTRGSYSENS